MIAKRGAAALQALRSKRVLDLRELDARSFPGWLERHLSHWRGDPVFVQRSRIRDLRRANPELQALEARREEARAAYAASSRYEEIEAVRRDLAGAENAVAGLTHALGREEDEGERERLRRKLHEFRSRVGRLQSELRELTDASAECVELERVTGRLLTLRQRVGFDRAVAELAALQRQQGRSSGRSGSSFERSAVDAVRAHVLPELDGGGGDPPLVILRGVGLGAARTEIDQLIIRPSRSPGDPVEVLALVETKRNPNDLARGLGKRLENLSWLSGHAAGYDREVYRTATYQSGHFDHPGEHVEGGEKFRFTCESFRRFLPDLHAGSLPKDFFLVTRPGPIWGIGSGGLARIAHRVATDMAWDPQDSTYLAELLRWCQSLTTELETPDLLQRYAASADVADRLIVLED